MPSHDGRVWRRRLRRGADEGASAVEYALIVAAVATVVVVIVFALGQVLNKSVTHSCDHIKQTLDANSAEQCVSSP